MEKKNLQKKQYKEEDGIQDLIEVHTLAIENNSKSLVEILEALSKKELSYTDRADLKKIKRELTSIDKKVDSLGVIKEEEESWW